MDLTRTMNDSGYTWGRRRRSKFEGTISTKRPMKKRGVEEGSAIKFSRSPARLQRRKYSVSSLWFGNRMVPKTDSKTTRRGKRDRGLLS